MDVSTLDYTVSSVTSSKIKQYAYYGFGVIEPFTEDGPGDTTQVAVSGKTFTITSGMGVRAVKVSAIMDGEVVDCIYLGTSGYSVSTPHTESELDAELYRQVRIRIENQLWTDDMTNLQKLNALADYIKSSTRYPNTAATSSNYEVNAQFVADFSVDNGFYLYYNMFSDSNISYAMALQGGIVTCYAANILYDAAIEELGLTDIYTSDGTVLDQEGVYLGAGSLSSNPTNSSHVSLIYYDANGNKYYIDAQGKTAAGDYSANILSLKVEEKLEITEQPQSVEVNCGDKVTFSVTATGSDLTYCWYYKKAGATAWSKWYTKSSFTATIASTWDGMQVYCVVTDGNGNSVSSDIATITLMEEALAITVQPTNVEINSGDKVTFSVTATGSGDISYQWYYKKSGATAWSKWYTKASFSATSSDTWDGMQVYCVVTDGNGNSVTSDTATITFIEAVLAITTQPQSVTISSGDKVTFGVTATKSDVSYQWYYKKSGATAWSKWYTKQSFTATSGSTWDGMQVYCVVTDTDGNSVSSDIATISFAADLEITQQPKSVTISSGDKVTFSVTATGNIVSYQWYYKKTGATTWSKWYTKQSFTAVSGSTWDGMQVYCVVTDTNGNSVSSSIATITFQ